VDEARLRERLERAGLERIGPALLSLAQPCVRIYIQRVDEDTLSLGTSKIGGRPDLPRGVEWPAWHVPMSFLAQFNLAEVAPYDLQHQLPSRGLLSFFIETAGEPLFAAALELGDAIDTISNEELAAFDESASWRVVYSQGDVASLVGRDFPPRVPLRLPACATRFAAALTVPELEEPEFSAVALTPAERNLLIDTVLGPCESVNRGRFEDGGHHLLGYPCNLDSLGRAAAAIAAGGAQPGDSEAACRWRLLLQLDSSVVAEMDWAGGGMLQWFIEADRLQAQDFSRVYVTMVFL